MKGVVVDMNAPPGPCATCGAITEVRPYGREGAQICFECWKKMKRKREQKKPENGYGAPLTPEELADRIKLKVSFFDGLEGRVWTVSEHYCVLFSSKTAEEADAYYHNLLAQRARSLMPPAASPAS